MSETGNQAGAPAHGLVLAAARRAQGLEVAAVARQLKLSTSQIEALESGSFDRLPGPVFVRGFVRNYARLLKLDPDEVWGAMESAIPANNPRGELPPSQDIPLPSAQPRRSWPRYAIAILLLLVTLTAYELYLDEGVAVEQLPVQTVTAPAAAPSGTNAVPPQTVPSTPVESVVASAAQGAPVPVAEHQAAVIVAAPAAPVASGNANQPAVTGEHELHLVFDKESWVEIRDRSGRAILSQTNKPGTEQRISGLPPFSLVIGNANGVKLMHNDNPVDLAQHTKVDVARFTLR
jgi:cytoskeleton protein RodZ